MDLPEVLTGDQKKNDGEANMDVETEEKASTSASATSSTSEKDEDTNRSPNDDANNDENNDNDDDDTASTDEMLRDGDDDDDDKGVSPEEAERLLLQAANLKEQGNTHFSQQKREDAVRCYRRALNRLKKLRRGPQPSTPPALPGSIEQIDTATTTAAGATNQNSYADPQVTALWVTLSTNLATALFQSQKFRPCVAAATQALEAQPMHVKALYRRAVAQRKLGSADEAVRDLQTALTVEPQHVACRKELQSLQQSLAKAKKAQKKALSKAFAAGVSLYDDKAGPPPPPTPEELAQALQQQKQQWEDECVSRMARNEPAVSFEEWQTEQTEKLRREAEEKTAREKAEAEAQKKKAAEERRAREKARKQGNKNKDGGDGGSGSSDDEDEKLTESELQALRGYKKTRDGRVTSYFTRELSPEEQAKLAAAPQGPQKLSNTTTTTTPNTPLAADPAVAAAGTDNNAAAATTKKKGPSAWNRAGTWEEKNTTEWCTEQLRQRLLQVKTPTSHVTKIDDLTGDASIVWSKGQQRHVFDFHATLQYAWTGGGKSGNDDDNDDTEKAPKRAKGTVRLPEISSTSTQEEGGLEVLFDGWKRQPATADALRQAVADRPALAHALQEAVHTWLADFHDHYRAH